MRIDPEISAASIVLLGSFNPAIFHPAWFFHHDAVSEADYDSATVNVVHSEITNFKLQWADVSVERGRFSVTTTYSPFVTIHDFVRKVFCELLPHTPLTAMGINRVLHFALETEEKRNLLGKKLAPSEPWGDWGKSLEGTPETRGGMISLTMHQTKPDDREAGHIRVKIEPSMQIASNRGVFMEINDQFDLAPRLEDGEGSQRIMQYLRFFEESIRHAEAIADQIMGLV